MARIAGFVIKRPCVRKGESCPKEFENQGREEFVLQGDRRIKGDWVWLYRAEKLR